MRPTSARRCRRQYLAGELSIDRVLLRPAEVYVHENVAWLKSTRAVWIDRANRRVRLDGGRELSYDALVLATGARPRRLPLAGADLAGVHVLRTAEDVDAIRPRSRQAPSSSWSARAISGSKSPPSRASSGLMSP